MLFFSLHKYTNKIFLHQTEHFLLSESNSAVSTVAAQLIGSR